LLKFLKLNPTKSLPMKKIQYYFFYIFFLITTSVVLAQTEDHPWQLSFGLNAVDFYPTGSPGQGDLFEEFFKISDHWNIAPYPSQIGLTNYLWNGFSLGLRLSHNTITKLGDDRIDSKFFGGLDGIIKYDLNKFLKTKRFSPFLETGGGYIFVGEVSAGYFNLGFGAEYALGTNKKTLLFAQSLFRNSGEIYANDHFQHSVGIAFRFDKKGKDSDEDGIVDEEDSCPDTPGLPEFNGCPDTDGDGIQDAEDNCPKVKGLAEFNGCPDSDGDGIEDAADSCPDVAGVEQFNGCPDSDGDGIQDAEDSCPDVAGVKQFNGCPDSDDDGVQDALDECPEVAGTKANNGCPEAYEKPEEILQIVRFAFNSKSLYQNAKKTIDEVVEILNKYPNHSIELQGHTDSVDSNEFNFKLSQMRAEEVANYLISKGISKKRLRLRAFGEEKPFTANSSESGRALNRRVEFKWIKE
jgi:OOP family OmpA-OmpF porin